LDAGLQYDTFWTFDLVTSKWTWIGGSEILNVKGLYENYGESSPNARPGARHAAICWSDPLNQFHWMFGGRGFGASDTQGMTITQ
jgi:hypothetical protein